MGHHSREVGYEASWRSLTLQEKYLACQFSVQGAKLNGFQEVLRK